MSLFAARAIVLAAAAAVYWAGSKELFVLIVLPSIPLMTAGKRRAHHLRDLRWRSWAASAALLLVAVGILALRPEGLR
jgi:hypothetical protein